MWKKSPRIARKIWREIKVTRQVKMTMSKKLLCVLSNQNNVNKKKDPESQMGKSEVG
jgi:hypothetical protein